MSQAATSSTNNSSDGTPTQAERVAVLGAGAWGTVVASLIARNGHIVRLWSHRRELAEKIVAEGRNPEYAPGLRLPPNLSATHDLQQAVEGVDLAFIVVPTPAIRSLSEELQQAGYAGGLVSCSKGLEVGSLDRISQVVADALPRAPFAVLSGPNLAGEIAAGLPAAATVASRGAPLAARIQRIMQQPTFRLYTSSDVAGVEAGPASALVAGGATAAAREVASSSVPQPATRTSPVTRPNMRIGRNIRRGVLLEHRPNPENHAWPTRQSST